MKKILLCFYLPLFCICINAAIGNISYSSTGNKTCNFVANKSDKLSWSYNLKRGTAIVEMSSAYLSFECDLTCYMILDGDTIFNIKDKTTSGSSSATIKTTGVHTLYVFFKSVAGYGGRAGTCAITNFAITSSTTPATLNKHEYVDLGLPSNTKWASHNVAALNENPTSSGHYFAWGETKQKESYTWEQYKFSLQGNAKVTKYCTNVENGNVDNTTELALEDDVAYTGWAKDGECPQRNK